MTAAIFGLVGVIVGGVMQGGASWLMERRREDWAARKAGRLMARAFTRSRFILRAGQEGHAPWGMIALEIRESLARWPEHADVLAGTIRDDEQWNEIVAAVESLQRIEQRGVAGPTDDDVSEKDRELLGFVAERSWAAAFTARLIGMAGVRPPNPLKRLWRSLRPRDIDAEARALVRYSYEAECKEPPEDFGSDDQPGGTPRADTAK